MGVNIFGDEVDGWTTPEGELYVVMVDVEDAFRKAGQAVPPIPPEAVEVVDGLDFVRVEVVQAH